MKIITLLLICLILSSCQAEGKADEGEVKAGAITVKSGGEGNPKWRNDEEKAEYKRSAFSKYFRRRPIRYRKYRPYYPSYTIPCQVANPLDNPNNKSCEDIADFKIGSHNFVKQSGLNFSGDYTSLFVKDNNVYVGSRDKGLGVSSDKGVNYSTYGSEVNGVQFDYVRDVVFDSDLNKLFFSMTNWSYQTTDTMNTFVEKNTAHGINNGLIMEYKSTQTATYLATYGGLAVSYDGGDSYDFFTYSHGLPTNTTLSVDVDYAEKAYIATNNGLSIYDGLYFENKYIEDGLVSNSLSHLDYDDVNQMLYVGTDFGLSISDDGGNTFYNGGVDQPIKKVFATSKGNLFVLTYLTIEYSSDRGETFEKFTTDQGLDSDDIRDIFEDESGSIWILTETSLYKSY